MLFSSFNLFTVLAVLAINCVSGDITIWCKENKKWRVVEIIQFSIIKTISYSTVELDDCKTKLALPNCFIKGSNSSKSILLITFVII